MTRVGTHFTTSANQIFATGYNDKGVLGTNTIDYYREPQPFPNQYDEQLKDYVTIQDVPEGVNHTYHKYVIRLQNKDIRDKVKEIGYEQDGFHWNKLKIYNEIHSQSADIGLGTDNFGAGDQGIMFGYACDNNDAYLPAPIYYAHEILKEIKEQRQHVLGPDSKSQVSIEYVGGMPKRVDQVVVSSQHGEGQIEQAQNICKLASMKVLGDLVDENTIWHLNPTGNFVIGGPDGDSGLTGRKIIVDTYGGFAPHGGGAFSGKDPTKVDRSAAYMARWLARQAVEMGYAKWATIQLSYAIGIKSPMAVYIDCNQEANKTAIENWISTKNLQPLGIIRKFDLFKFADYSNNCTYGHFGNKDVPWEKK